MTTTGGDQAITEVFGAGITITIITMTMILAGEDLRVAKRADFMAVVASMEEAVFTGVAGTAAEADTEGAAAMADNGSTTKIL